MPKPVVDQDYSFESRKQEKIIDNPNIITEDAIQVEKSAWLYSDKNKNIKIILPGFLRSGSSFPPLFCRIRGSFKVT